MRVNRGINNNKSKEKKGDSKNKIRILSRCLRESYQQLICHYRKKRFKKIR